MANKEEKLAQTAIKLLTANGYIVLQNDNNLSEHPHKINYGGVFRVKKHNRVLFNNCNLDKLTCLGFELN